MSQAIPTPNRRRLLVVGIDYAPEQSENGPYSIGLAERIPTTEGA